MKFLWEEKFFLRKHFSGETLFSGKTHFWGEAIFSGATQTSCGRHFFRGRHKFRGETFIGGSTLFRGATFFRGVKFFKVYTSFADENYQHRLIFNTLYTRRLRFCPIESRPYIDCHSSTIYLYIKIDMRIKFYGRESKSAGVQSTKSWNM